MHWISNPINDPAKTWFDGTELLGGPSCAIWPTAGSSSAVPAALCQSQANALLDFWLKRSRARVEAYSSACPLERQLTAQLPSRQDFSVVEPTYDVAAHSH
jgi:hypothetical protein